MRTLKRLSLILLVLCVLLCSANAEETESNLTLFVTATSGLNGRIRPTQKAEAVAFWEEGDILHPTGRWSKDYQWIEVESAEWQTVWVHIGYFSE